MSDPFEQRSEDYKALALTLAQMFANTDKAQREQLARELALMVSLEQEDTGQTTVSPQIMATALDGWLTVNAHWIMLER